MAEELKFTEQQHLALLTDAVARETAGLQAQVEALQTETASLNEAIQQLTAEKAELQTRIDVVEAERAQAEQARDAVRQEFEDFKTELDRQRAVEERKAARVERIKAAAPGLAESYFTDERIQRWAEMADEQFDALLADLTELASSAAPKGDGEGATDKARETAAFTAGVRPAATPVGGSTLASYLTARGHAPLVPTNGS